MQYDVFVFQFRIVWKIIESGLGVNWTRWVQYLWFNDIKVIASNSSPICSVALNIFHFYFY